MADHNLDSRGIHRGKCSFYGCNCQQYHGEIKCKCGHPPGKHENLTVPSPQTQQPAAPPVTGAYAAATRYPYPAGGTAYHGSVASQPTSGYPNSFGAGGFTTGSGGYSGATSYRYNPQPQYTYGQYGEPDPYQYTSSLPLCKAEGCKKLVFCDSVLGAFDYCSPKCRDTHLLPQEQDKLKKDLKKFTDDLCKNAPPSPPQETSRVSDKQQASNSRPAQGGRSQPTLESRGSGSDTKNVAHSSNKQKKNQKTKAVMFKEVKKKGFGLIFSQVGYTSESISGCLITGVEKESEAYKLFQGDELRLLDVVIKFNGEDVTSSAVIVRKAHSMNSFSLTVDRSISLLPTASLFATTNTYLRYFTHILVLRSPRVFDNTEFGVGVRTETKAGVRVCSITTGSSSHDSGLKFADLIMMCAKADQKEVGAPTFTELDSALKDFFSKEKSLVIAITRSKQTSI